MTKIIETFDQGTIKTDWKTQYIRYRLGRLKHQYWLLNRKQKDQAVIDSYDYAILKNCQPGHTVFFGSAGYYIKDIVPEVTVVEMHPVVKTFYPDVYICNDRSQIDKLLPALADNFAVVNNRADIWTELENITQHCINYTTAMNPGCRFFYSFRDTQIVVNRLTTDLTSYFLQWATSLEQICNLKLVWFDVGFVKKEMQHGRYDTLEMPDTTNGNLKFWFVYKGEPLDPAAWFVVIAILPPDVDPTVNKLVGDVVPIPTLPAEVIRIFSAEVPLAVV